MQKPNTAGNNPLAIKRVGSENNYHRRIPFYGSQQDNEDGLTQP